MTDVGLQHSAALFPDKTSQFPGPLRKIARSELEGTVGGGPSYQTMV